MTRRATIVAATLLTFGTPAVAQNALARGRQLTAWLLAGETKKLLPLLSVDMRTVMHGDSGLASYVQQLRAQVGAQKRIVSEDTSVAKGLTVYRAVTEFTRIPARMEIRLAWNAAGSITGLLVAPIHEAAPTRFLDYQTKTPLHLPFRGDWFVFWGGRTLKQNYHAEFADQRFAYDFLITRNAQSHLGNGKSNADYYCFGQPVFAPAGGTVVVAVDEILDNIPGQTDTTHAAGNHVIIDHGNGEFSVLAHFRRGSVRVKKGQLVKAGDPLGECGNSGDSAEPHVHYHLQDGPVFRRGQGLPAFFVDYIANGAKVARGEPQQGQFVRR